MNNKRMVVGVGLLALVLKLILSAYTHGTNDIDTWYTFALTVNKIGSFKMYSALASYNHPPLMSWILLGIYKFYEFTGISFPYLFRIFPITADFFSLFIIWKLLNVYKYKHINIILLISAFNPVSFLVAGFHGNTDPVFVCLLLAAIYFAEINKYSLAGFLLGLSMCIKIVPIIFIPLFIVYIASPKSSKIKIRNKSSFTKREDFISRILNNFSVNQIKFIFFLFFPFLIIYLPHIGYDFIHLFRNIFLYGGVKGIWGFSHLIALIMKYYGQLEPLSPLGKLFVGYNAATPILVILISLFVPFKLLKPYKLNLLEGGFVILSMFMVVTSGFGVQYLSWLVYFAIISSPVMGSLFAIISGIFLSSVYLDWSHYAYPFNANSIGVSYWPVQNLCLMILVWLTILIMLASFLKTKN